MISHRKSQINMRRVSDSNPVRANTSYICLIEKIVEGRNGFGEKEEARLIEEKRERKEKEEYKRNRK